jgi:3-oxoadipate enol-lactonase
VPIAENHGARLHWDERGQGTPILLVMGHRYSSAMWYPLIPALAERHRVIWFDNRGTGGSDTTPKVTVQGFAADALAVMDAAGVERAHVFGVSMGGVIVQELALQQPGRVISLIVGCSGLLSADKPRAPAALRLLYYLPPWALRRLMSRGPGGHGYGTAAPLDRVAADQAMLAKDVFTVRGVVAQSVAMNGYRTTKEAVAALTMPALVLHGDEDTTVPIAWGEELARTLPNSRFVKVPGAGHNFIVAATDTTAETVLGFIEEADRNAG